MTNDIVIRRLRAANPVPHVAPVEDAALFERVVSAAPDEPLAAGRYPLRRPLLVLAVVVLLAAVATSTAPALSNWIGDVIGRDDVASEYGAATKQLTLPPGYGWPRNDFPPNSVTSRGAGGAQAVLISQVAWECYWVRAIATHDGAAEQRARSALADLMANHVVVAPNGAPESWSPPRHGDAPLAVYADDGGYELKQRAYAAAAAGDSTLVAQSCRANAPPGWR